MPGGYYTYTELQTMKTLAKISTHLFQIIMKIIKVMNFIGLISQI